MNIKAGIVVFPGTNCDRDTFEACEAFGWNTQYIWHFDDDLQDFDVIFLPGGFSYGDYVQAGRLAKFSPVMQAVKKFVKSKRGVVVGICNGFQILCEARLLPGALTVNENMKFICKEQKLISRVGSPTHHQKITLPIAHEQGRYFADSETLEYLKKNDMIFLTYENNPNGSIEDIAGLYDRKNRVIGMMPHPERAFFKELGNEDGREIFKGIENGKWKMGNEEQKFSSPEA